MTAINERYFPGIMNAAILAIFRKRRSYKCAFLGCRRDKKNEARNAFLVKTAKQFSKLQEILISKMWRQSKFAAD